MGNGILFLQARQKLFSWFVKCERKFGYETFQISVPSLPPGVVINDPHNLDYVFKNEGVFGKGDFVKSRSWDLFGTEVNLPLSASRLLTDTCRQRDHQCRRRALAYPEESRAELLKYFKSATIDRCCSTKAHSFQH